MSGVDGVRRSLERVWRLLVDQDSDARLADDEAPSDAVLRAMHKTVEKVTPTSRACASTRRSRR